MNDDLTLLRKYAAENSEAAFDVLVSRYINLVYSVALRQVRDVHSAEEITQAVFIILSRKANQLGDKIVLSGWLCRTARYACAEALRNQDRRQQREQEAYMRSTLNEPASENWVQIEPLLDAAMEKLRQKDHDALVLRFFENKNFADIGAVLGTSEDAAKMRVSRALEKLRKIFSKRGVDSTTAAIAGTISANSIQAAPVSLAKTISPVAIAKGAAASASTLTLVKGALKVMAWTKTKTAIVVGIGLLVVVGTASITVKEIEAHRALDWQKKYDLSFLGKVPPQVIILPTLNSTLQSRIHVLGNRNGQALGLGQSVPDLVMISYHVQSAQLIWDAPVPEGKYDFIDNLPKDQSQSLQQEIHKVFGLAGQYEIIKTNVLILAVQSRNASGLRRADPGEFSGDMESNSYSAHGQGIYPLVDYLESHLGIVIIDQTKLRGTYDIDFQWNGETAESLKQALLDQAGLELTPTNMPIKMLVVETGKYRFAHW